MTAREEFSIAGDLGVGDYVPPVTILPAWPRVSEELLQRIRSLPAAASTASDLLDELGSRWCRMASSRVTSTE
jgi:hypothetical protein